MTIYIHPLSTWSFTQFLVDTGGKIIYGRLPLTDLQSNLSLQNS